VGSLFVDAESVLVVIDTQLGFLRKVDSGVAADVVSRIAWLVEVARRFDVPIVVTEEEPDLHGPTHESIVAALGDDQPRLTKPTFGLASSPHILEAATATGRGQAVLCGLETDVCVAQSAIGLRDLGWQVGVVRDAVASPGRSHEQGLARMAAAGVALVGVKGLAYEWVRAVERLGSPGLPKPSPAGIVL
jgi:nicotinamidase-related amidase